MKVKNDHRSKFSNLSSRKEEAWKKNRIAFHSSENRSLVGFPFSACFEEPFSFG